MRTDAHIGKWVRLHGFVVCFMLIGMFIGFVALKLYLWAHSVACFSLEISCDRRVFVDVGVRVRVIVVVGKLN